MSSTGETATSSRKKAKVDNPLASIDAATAKILQDIPEADGERYDNDATFREVYGPSISAYGDCGMDYSLLGLTMQIDFGSFGTL